MTEEERAALHRQHAKARASYRKSQERALRGDPVAAKSAQAKWKPVLDWVRGK